MALPVAECSSYWGKEADARMIPFPEGCEDSSSAAGGREPHVFIVFTTFYGMGHLTRVSALAHALSVRFRVTLVSCAEAFDGYAPPAGVEFLQLPPLRWQLGVGIVPIEEGLSLEDVAQARARMLLAAYRGIRPDVIITEFYPFAPRRFAGALDLLFDALRNESRRPLIVSSIRSFPQFDWQHVEECGSVNARLRHDFDLVLHHVDPKILPLGRLDAYMQSALQDIDVRQTGFVRRPDVAGIKPKPGRSGLLMTVGSGARDAAGVLVRWIHAARAAGMLEGARAVCGPRMVPADRNLVCEAAAGEVQVHALTDRMDELLRSCSAVVCMGGYNTMLEALSVRKPVLAFPRQSEGEQYAQVKMFSDAGFLKMGSPDWTSAELASALQSLPAISPDEIPDCGGATASAELIFQRCRTRGSIRSVRRQRSG
jgi:predicted glycosyltransferase